jgi:hypothetical protein
VQESGGWFDALPFPPLLVHAAASPSSNAQLRSTALTPTMLRDPHASGARSVAKHEMRDTEDGRWASDDWNVK